HPPHPVAARVGKAARRDLHARRVDRVVAVRESEPVDGDARREVPNVTAEVGGAARRSCHPYVLLGGERVRLDTANSEEVLLQGAEAVPHENRVPHHEGAEAEKRIDLEGHPSVPRPATRIPETSTSSVSIRSRPSAACSEADAERMLARPTRDGRIAME